MKVGVPKESFPGENRVALIPASVQALLKKGFEVHVQSGAGMNAGFKDDEYSEKGAAIVNERGEVFKNSDIILQVRAYPANPERGKSDLDLIHDGQVIIGMTESLSEPRLNEHVAQKGATLFSMELMPRITRAQSMDVLSSMASIAGYKAVLIAAEHLPKMFPMMMTAAGTISAAKAFIIGAGVAGLQAIATAKRLGASVKAYDIRPAVKEQVQSLGADFVELELETGTSEDKGGYAKAMDEEFYRRQRELMTGVIKDSDVVITTAAVPGKKAPILITSEMVKDMNPGSVIVDLAAERGGNCDFTEAGEIIDYNGITVAGPLNIPATVPYHASQMYAKNISTFLTHIIKEGRIDFNLEDEITKDTMVARGGEIVHPHVLEILRGAK
ncbi:MAG: Re/Si-specific NAD(P)(+) transhydrogenase subunit alpha [candidate division Zixibacteria bacterium]|nr:Re/Si-specific NAD(P)(+) transhydrogenase subunit alpha [candidate division Zixibacteria bacterium]